MKNQMDKPNIFMIGTPEDTAIRRRKLMPTIAVGLARLVSACNLDEPVKPPKSKIERKVRNRNKIAAKSRKANRK